MIEYDMELFAVQYFASVADTDTRGIVYAAPVTEASLFIWNIVDMENIGAGNLRVIGDSMAVAVLKAREEGRFSLHLGYITPSEMQSLENVCREDGMKVGSMLREGFRRSKSHLRIVPTT